MGVEHQKDQALKAQAAQGAELAFRDARIRHLETQLEAQAAQHQEAEQKLRNRIRLLQAWCFRTWWSLEAAGSTGFPGLLTEDAVAPDGAGRQVRVKEGGSSRPANESVVPTKAPMPDNWRSVLRFQASL